MQVNLFDICRPTQWKTISTKDLSKSGYPLYGANGKIGFYPDYNHENPTLLITCRGATCGSLTISEPKSYINGNAMALDDLDEDKVNIKYLFYFLQDRGFSDVISGSAQPQITRQGLQTIQVPLSLLENQKRIVRELDAADALRQKRKQAIALLDDYLKAVFLEMFGDPMTNPKRWELKKLSDVADICSGVTKGRKLDKTTTVSVPYMRVANVQDENIDLREVKEIDVLPSDIEKYKLVSGDLLLTEGGDPDKLGRGGIWKGQIKNCIHQNHIFRVRLNRVGAIPEFISAQIGSSYGKRYFLKSAKQTTGIATINITQLKCFPVLLPPVELQLKYSKVVGGTGLLKQIMLNQSQELDTQFQALMQSVFMDND